MKKMDTEVACHDLRELGIIDENMLHAAIVEQGPKGEEGRLFKQKGIVYEEVTNLRLEFLDILKIDHLWMLTGLTKLQLSNNLIEKIENLSILVNLEELDLSFNCIERIENLSSLQKLQVLTLYQNKIRTLENLDTLSSLTILSVGNNIISDYKNIVYLRKIEKLKSLNMSGNPICAHENFIKFIIAYLPRLIYYEYSMIPQIQKDEAREVFLKDLMKLEREEQELKEIHVAKQIEEKQECLNAEAFVEYIGGNHLFLALFDKDIDCKPLLQMGDNVTDLYNEFMRNFDEVTTDLRDFGLAQLQVRKSEIARFNKYIGHEKKQAYEESRAVVEDFTLQKIALFHQLREVMCKEVEDDDIANEVSLSLQLLNEAFKDLCHRTWTALMKKELNLFEGIDEANGIYERSVTELVNQFVEGAQARFTQLRQLQGVFNEGLADAANKCFTHYTVSTATATANEYKYLPSDLTTIMQDKELLLNALSASHDYHLLVIDQREDKLVTGIKTWLLNLIDTVISSEIDRHRTTIMEINHFMDIQKAELHDLLSTPVGLNLLPKEIQDALQN